ncbi:hypothetical protein VTK56DRAFT_9707 [Thermocarpiscus australiensis]
MRRLNMNSNTWTTWPTRPAQSAPDQQTTATGKGDGRNASYSRDQNNTCARAAGDTAPPNQQTNEAVINTHRLEVLVQAASLQPQLPEPLAGPLPARMAGTALEDPGRGGMEQQQNGRAPQGEQLQVDDRAGGPEQHNNTAPNALHLLTRAAELVLGGGTGHGDTERSTTVGEEDDAEKHTSESEEDVYIRRGRARSRRRRRLVTLRVDPEQLRRIFGQAEGRR